MAFIGLGAVAYNDTKYPGICKPSDAATLAVFKNVQAQLNRVAQGLSITKVSVDGDLGPATQWLLQQISGALSQGGVSVDPARNILMQAGPYTCEDIANNATMLANAANGVATQLGVPGAIGQPGSGSTSTLVSGSGVEVKVKTPTPAASASVLDSLGGMDAGTLLLIAGGLGAAVYFMNPKKKRASSKSHRSSRRYR